MGIAKTAMEKIEAIAAACHALSNEARDDAIAIIREYYPFAPDEITKRRYGPVHATQVFIRDGFVRPILWSTISFRSGPSCSLTGFPVRFSIPSLENRCHPSRVLGTRGYH